MPKPRFFLLILFLFLLPFIFTGCFKKQEADTDIWSGDKASEEDEIISEEGSQREAEAIGEVPKSKEDLKKLLERLEKDSAKATSDIDESTLDIDASAVEEGGSVAPPEEEEIDVSDIDNL
ncbi:MAG: hypothetical protein PHR36_00780 [Patescibacteria group bacterium]|nr:hypothetical protein [Patescibacteria group bacterium]